jgi:dTMP kinase
VAERGRFIVFEGGEASGKSTQASRLSAAIGARLTREPGGTPLGEALRPMTLFASNGPIDVRTELLLMVAARAEHVARVIRPTLEAGVHVVCDRFSGSTIAYQGYGRGLPIEDVVAACELATDGLQPDLNVLLDLEVGDARARRNRADDQIESAGSEFHHRVRAGFRMIAGTDPPHWAIVDASEGPDEVEKAVHAVLFERLGLRVQ